MNVLLIFICSYVIKRIFIKKKSILLNKKKILNRIQIGLAIKYTILYKHMCEFL